MSTATLEDPETESTELDDRLRRLEGEVAELRHTVAELAEIVVGDIKERKEVAASVSAPISEIEIPASLVPGGQTTLTAVRALRRPWLLIDLFKELGATLRMYMDPRYRVRRATQLIVPLVLASMVATYFFFHSVFDFAVVGPLFEHLVQLILAILLYKVVSREVARYRQMLVQLAAIPRTIRSIPASLLNNDPDTGPVIRQELG